MPELVARIGRARLMGLAAVIAAAVLALGVLVLSLGSGDDPAPDQASPAQGQLASPTKQQFSTATPEASPTPIKHAGILDGVAMSDQQWAERKDLLPLAVMVDNTTGAYPHTGLDTADLVYEALVEGGITRLMAVYWRLEAAKILPVRSARTPFVIWASELGALYGHAGGAVTENDANAMGQIYEWEILDLNAFSTIPSNYYYRDAERYGPYDLATSTDDLREAADRMGFSGPSAVESWKFRDPGTLLPSGKPAGGIAVDFSGRLYAWQYIQWKWDAGANRYLRFQFGGPHVDAVSGGQLAFASVIVMQAPSQVVDDDGHLIYDQLGTGPATVFTGGQAFEGTWKKQKRESRTRFYTLAGEEIVFERGPVFVEFISSQSTFAYFAAAGDLPTMPAYEPPPPGSFPVPEDAGPSPSPSPVPTPTASASPGTTATAAPSPAGTPSPSATAQPPKSATPGP